MVAPAAESLGRPAQPPPPPNSLLACLACLLQVGPRQWQRVLDMVSKIRGLGMEVCTTLGMVTPEQVRCTHSCVPWIVFGTQPARTACSQTLRARHTVPFT